MNAWQSFVGFIGDFIHRVPDVVWSGVIASLLTLSGVFLTNRDNTNRLLLQLRNDSKERQKDRISNTRKEIYLEAASEMSKAHHSLSTLPDIDPAQEIIAARFVEFFATLGKVQIICEPATAVLVNT